MTCEARHTKFQPSDDEWKCPKCGATSLEGFCIDDISCNSDINCNKLHCDDYCRCDQCGYHANGATIARRICEKIGLVKCECCNGTGFAKNT
jgi:hypothetical protein